MNIAAADPSPQGGAVNDRSNEQIVLDVLDAVEKRDGARLAALYHPEIEFHWPPALPYGGVHRGRGIAEMSAKFAAIWMPLQQTEAERRMDPQVVAAKGDDVVVRYIWKGCDREAVRFAAETIALYRIRDGKLVRAQMFHYDLTGLLSFLAAAKR